MIMLRPLPPWTSPLDVRRMAERAHVDGIRNSSSRLVYLHRHNPITVILHYDKYINFTGEAFIKFPSVLLAREAAQKLRGSQLSAIPLEHPVLVPNEHLTPSPSPQHGTNTPPS